LSKTKHPPLGTPLLSYPDDSEFGRVINAQPNGNTLAESNSPVLQTAFSASAVSLVKLGAGIAWVPQSLIQNDLRSGEIVALAQDYGRLPMDIVLSTQSGNEIGIAVLEALLATT
jgi:DNA-binding transcriptional LysR family regulator